MRLIGQRSIRSRSYPRRTSELTLKPVMYQFVDFPTEHRKVPGDVHQQNKLAIFHFPKCNNCARQKDLERQLQACNEKCDLLEQTISTLMKENERLLAQISSRQNRSVRRRQLPANQKAEARPLAFEVKVLSIFFPDPSNLVGLCCLLRE